MKLSLTFEASNEEELTAMRIILEQATLLMSGVSHEAVLTGDVLPEIVSNDVTPIEAPLQATVTADAGGLDTRGVPWSVEHHAGTKATLKSGAWRPKKGGDKATRDAYESQFSAPDAPAPAPIPTASAAPDAPAPAPIPTAPDAPAPAPGAPAPAPGAPAPAPGAPAPAPIPTNPLDILTARLSEVVKDDTHTVDLSEWGGVFVNIHQMPALDAMNVILQHYKVGSFGEITQIDASTIDALNQVVAAAWPQ